MSYETPSVSIVIPTLNCGPVLRLCLESVAAQSYQQRPIEVIIADGGSRDDTVAVARSFGATVIENPLRTAEAGKAAGLARASNEIVVFIDSDNVLPGPDWLAHMTRPFAEKDIVAAEPVEYTWRSEDPPLTRYCALLGMNDPLCYFTGNYDRRGPSRQRWTRVPHESHPRSGYERVLFLDPHRLPTMGANGFAVRREALTRLAGAAQYLYDVDVLRALSTEPVAKVDVGIVHLYASSLRAFARKQRRRIRDYQVGRRKEERSFAWSGHWMALGAAGLALSCILLLPLVATSFRGWWKKPDLAWFLHVPACWITFSIYAFESIRDRIAPLDDWDRDRPAAFRPG